MVSNCTSNSLAITAEVTTMPYAGWRFGIVEALFVPRMKSLYVELDCRWRTAFGWLYHLGM